ncbi:MAG: class I SAM-dependent methyltransferase [Solirubrobacteraceae bacterium]
MRQRRLVFGEVAELYDRHRPSYPPALIDDLIAKAALDGSRAVLEVGAGTGKATVLFARCGIPVVAVEPSPEMAAVAGRAVGGCADVGIEQSDFEAWDPRGRRFPLLFSAQAWHWVTPAVGLAKAREVLLPGGILAPFWNRVAWEKADIREALTDVYQAVAPELSRDGPMHPANLLAESSDHWEAEIEAVDGLTDPEVRFFEWQQQYPAAEYAGLLATASEVRLLDVERRDALLAAVIAAIAAHGEPVSIPMRTRLCLARRA